MDVHDRNSSVVWIGKPAWSAYVFLWFFAAIMAIRGIISFRLGYWDSMLFHLAVVGMLSALAFFLRRSTHYKVTRKAVHRSKGFLGKEEQTFPLTAIVSVDEQQGPLDRLFGSGDVVLHLKEGTRQRLAGVKDPDVVCRKIRALL
jgi:membrane protein YdbS with pleckstrin-like domain